MPTGSGPTREVLIPIALRAGGRVVYTLNARREVIVAETLTELFRQDSSPETARRIDGALDPRLCIDGDKLSLVIDDNPKHPLRRGLNIGMGARIEVRINDQPAATGVFRPQWTEAVSQSWEVLNVQWQPGMKDVARAAPDSVRIIIRGDPAISGEIYRLWPFIGAEPACWTGSFEVMPRLVDCTKTPQRPRQ